MGISKMLSLAFKNQGRQERIVLSLLLGYFSFLSLTNFSSLPYIGHGLQLTEVCFLLLAIAALPLYKKLEFIPRTALDLVVCIYGVIVVFSFIQHGGAQVLKESLGTLYLCFAYFLFSRLFLFFRKHLMVLLCLGFYMAIGVGMMVGILSLVAYYSGVSDQGVLYYSHYPYWGNIARLKGLADSPNMLLSNLSIVGIVYLSLSDFRMRWWQWIAFLVVCVFTFSKSLLLLTVALFLVAKKLFTWRFSSFTIGSLIAGSVILFVALTWFVIAFDSQQLSLNQEVNSAVVGEEAVYQKADLSIYPTSHFYLEIASLEIIKNTFPNGCGFGNYRSAIASLQKEGNYPDHIAPYEPHDAYLSQMAELGWGGLLFLILLGYSLLSAFRSINLGGRLENALLICIFYMAAESICVGTIHFRHFWIVLAIIGGLHLMKVKGKEYV